MKVIFISKVPFPIGMAATKRISCYAKGLSDNGILSEILVINSTEKTDSIINKQAYGHIADKATFRYIGGSTIRHGNLIIRKWHDLVDVLQTIRYCLRHGGEQTIIYNYGDDVILHVLFKLVCLFTHAKQCRELCEYPFYTVENVSFLRRVKNWITLHILFKWYDGIVAISESLYHLAEIHKGKRTKLIKIPILVSEIPSSDEVFQDEQTLFHAGKINEQKDGFMGMLKAYAITQETYPSFNFYVSDRIEHSQYKDEIIKILVQYGITDKVHFLGYLSEQELQNMHRRSTFFVINKKDTFQNRYCFPTKLGEYLLYKKAVVTTDIGEANYYLRDKVNALIVPHDNIEALSAAFVWLLSHKSEREVIAYNGYTLAKKEFSINYQGERLTLFFKSLIEFSD